MCVWKCIYAVVLSRGGTTTSRDELCARLWTAKILTLQFQLHVKKLYSRCDVVVPPLCVYSMWFCGLVIIVIASVKWPRVFSHVHCVVYFKCTGPSPCCLHLQCVHGITSW